MERPAPGPFSSPPGPRPVPPPRKGSMERRPPREPSDGKGPTGQPGTPERATVTQRVLIVMEGRSSTSPSLRAPEESGLGGQRGVREDQGPPPPQYNTEDLGPPPPESTINVTDQGPLPPQYITEDVGPPPPRYITEDLGPPPPESTTSVPDSGPIPHQYIIESQGPPPPESTTNVLHLGPVPHQYITESQGPPPPESTTNVLDLGPVPHQYITEIRGPPPPGSTTNVLDLGPVPHQYITERLGPPPPGSTTNVLDLGPVPPQHSSAQSRAMVSNVDDRIPPPRDSPRKGPQIRPVWVLPRRGLQTAPLGATPILSQASLSTHNNGGLEQGPSLPAVPPMSGEKSAIKTSGPDPPQQAAQSISAPQDTPVHPVPSRGQRQSLSDNIAIKVTQEGEMAPLQDGGPHSREPGPSLLHKRTALAEGVTVAAPVMSSPHTMTEETGPSQSLALPSMEAPTQGGQNPPSTSCDTIIEQLQSAITPDISALPRHTGIGTSLPDGTSHSSTAPPQDSMTPGAVIGPPIATPLHQQQDTVEKGVEALPGVGGAAPSDQNANPQASNPPMGQPTPVGTSLSPSRINDPSSPHRNMSSKPPLPIPPRSCLYPGHAPSLREHEPSLSHETASLSSFRSKVPAPDTLSYLDSVSLMSGTLESLTHLDDASSLGSDSEINGMPYRKTDKYGFLGGSQYSGNGEGAISVEIARQRELKWLEMFNHWDKWLTRRFQKVKLRCRKGIPSSLRARAWQYLCNGHEILSKNPGTFEDLERQPGDPKWLDVIEKDLHRQFPFHEMFAARGGHGQQDLYRILKAYTVYRPEEGYCQAQAPVAAVLLMHMPAEQAFWCLVQICDKYLPGYYSAGLEAIQLDGEIFFALLRRVCPMAYRHLKKFKIDPILYMTEWFMCIFSRTLPWSSVLRVWDMFFCEGVKIVFRVGLVLLRHTLGSVDKLRSCQGMYETMEKLRSLPPHCMQEEVLLPEVSSLPVTDALIERESNTQLRKWRENRGELQYRPSRRLHGARQILEEKLRLNPALSGSRLSLSSLRRPSPPPPPASPALALQPESVVVSEGLHPVLPSPTANKAPLGPPKEASKKGKDKPKEHDKRKEREEREREKKREKEEREERERERKREKEKEKQKEREEKRLQKEKEKAEAKQKKERKYSFRRKESSSPAADSSRRSGTGPTDSTAAAHDTYF